MVRFGVILPQEGCDYPTIRTMALECERLGFDSIWVNDHFFFSGGKPYLESWTLLSALATQTAKLRLGTLVLCNSYRYPSVLAKMAATLDVISEGRLEFGIGAGWFQKEFMTYGIPFPNAGVRISQLREAVQLIKLMWTQEKASFQGKYYTIKDAVCDPKPHQKPHPPIWVGGYGKSLLKVVAEQANGCNFEQFDMSPDMYQSHAEVLKQHCVKIGRDFGSIQKSFSTIIVIGNTQEEIQEGLANITRGTISLQNYSVGKLVGEAISHPRRAISYLNSRILGLKTPPSYIVGTPDQCINKIKQYTMVGVTYFMLRFPRTKSFKELEVFAEEVIPAFKKQ